MERDTYLKFSQLLVIIISWILVGFIITVYDHLVLNSYISQGPSKEYSFLISCFRNMGAGLIGGILGGSFLVFYINVKFQDKPYGYTIVAVTLSFLAVVIIVTIVMAMTIVPLRTGRPLSDPVTRSALANFISDTAPLKAFLSWFFVVVLTQVLLLVNKKFGYGSFWKIITGKYNTPKEEKRIFMFVDLNSSTTIAENLGSQKYHALLKDFFTDITIPILNHRGSIYQYAGDEVVISWAVKNGLEEGNPIGCFFEMKDVIERNRDKYIQRYGLIPTFKAGIHSGDVIAGEVGIIKRDITYSGDVLNTTARIQSKCREFETDIIVSDHLLSQFNIAETFYSFPLGLIKLRGKEKEMLLHAIRRGVNG